MPKAYKRRSGVFHTGYIPYIVLAIAVIWWLYGKFSLCHRETNEIYEEARFIAESSACREDRDSFKNAIDCGVYEKRLSSRYMDDMWWKCFMESFYFYSSWYGNFLFLLICYAFISNCKFKQKIKQPQVVYMRPYDDYEIEEYDSPPLRIRDQSPQRQLALPDSFSTTRN